MGSSGPTKLRVKSTSLSRINTETITKAFVLFYLHQIMKEADFLQFLKNMTNLKDMNLAIQIFNCKEIDCEEMKNYILGSKVFVKMCRLIDTTNKLILKYLNDSSLIELRNMFKKVVGVDRNITLESIVQSTCSFPQSTHKQTWLNNLAEVIDLTLDDESDTSSSESSSSDSSSDEDEEKPSFPMEKPILDTPSSFAKKRSLLTTSISHPTPVKKVKVDNLAQRNLITCPDSSNLLSKDVSKVSSSISTKCSHLTLARENEAMEEEEGLVPLNMRKRQDDNSSKEVEKSSSISKIPSVIAKATPNVSIYNRSQTKWQITEDKTFLSLVFSKDSFLQQWGVLRKEADFTIYESKFSRTSKSLYTRWRQELFPLICLYHRGSEVPCWRLHFFNMLKEKGYKSEKDIPWFQIIQTLPFDNLQIYKSLVRTFVSRLPSKSFSEVINFAIAKLKSKLSYVEELKLHYHQLFQEQQQSKEPGKMSNALEDSNIDTSSQSVPKKDDAATKEALQFNATTLPRQVQPATLPSPSTPTVEDIGLNPESEISSVAKSPCHKSDPQKPFDFSESKAIIDVVFLHHPNLDLQSCELKPSFFINTLPHRSLPCVYMHWEKLVCINLFAARKENWKISLLEFIAHWGFSSFCVVFTDQKVTKLYSHVPVDNQKSFIKTCILFAETVIWSASFLSKIKYCYDYLRLKKGDLAQYDQILGYSIPLFSPHQTEDKKWESAYKARVSFTFPERLEILKKVIQFHPNSNISTTCPSVSFFTSIAPEFDRSYVSLKYQWERSIRAKLLLFDHGRLHENWELKVLEYFVKSKLNCRHNIDFPKVIQDFPYVTPTAVNHLIVKAIKRNVAGSLLSKLRSYMEVIRSKDITEELKPWKEVIDFYKSFRANQPR